MITFADTKRKALKRIQGQIEMNEDAIKLNRKYIMKRAWYLSRKNRISLSDALKQVWREHRSFVALVRIELLAQKDILLNWYTPSFIDGRHQEIFMASHSRIMEIALSRGEKVGD